MTRRFFPPAALLAAVLALAGCQAIGPGTIKRDRIDYVSAIGESWKQQTLLNITRLRCLLDLNQMRAPDRG